MSFSEEYLENDTHEVYMSRKKFLLIGLIFTIVLIILSWCIITYLYDKDFLSSFPAHYPNWQQFLIGSFLGVCGALVILNVLRIKKLSTVKIFFNDIIRGLKLKMSDILIISCCAGLSEEIFFRGSLQPYLGIWITSIIFISLHGYLNPFNWKMSVIGTMMVLVSAGLGYLYELVGLLSAICAHTTFDIVMLYYFVIYIRRD
ncbi:CPBP family intramembrane metalloprotease [Candidatus Amoebophilus asiaticus]|nr:CPBP family intramembrane metalloprotease [Candidatus Amoebophilus asiaticus]